MPPVARKTRLAPLERKAKRSRRPPSKNASLLVRFDRRAKGLVQQAATVRGLTVSDYVRTRILPLAKQDVEESKTGLLRLPKEDQIAFWQALQDPPEPSPSQRALGKLVRSLL